MPDEQDDQKQDVTPPAQEAAPTPSYVTREELQSQSEALISRIQGLLEGAQMGRQAPAAPTAPTAPDFSAINEAIAEGRGAETIQAIVNRVVESKVAEAVATHVDPLRTVGLSNLEQIARAQALGGKKHAKKYEREIDTLMRNVDPASRSSVDAWNKAYAMAVGLHQDEIEREAVEAAVRQALSQRVEQSPKGGSAPVDDDGSPLPTVEEAFGKEWTHALSEKGQTPDEWARKAGYPDMKSYLKLYKQMDSYKGELI